MTAQRHDAGDQPTVLGLESAIGRVLLAGTLAGVALLLAGVVLMAASGIDPTSRTGARFDPATLLAELVAGRPDGFLWAGIVVLIGTPIARVVGDLIAFAYRRDRLMAAVAVAILGIIGLSVALATLSEA